MIATPQMALDAAAKLARDKGLAAYVLSDRIEGEARDVGKVMAAIAQQVAGRNEPFAAPCVLLSGGETTVTVRGKGRGGRNVEFLLVARRRARRRRPAFMRSPATRMASMAPKRSPAPISRPIRWRAPGRKGIKPQEALAANDGHGFFQALGDSVVTGPTLTNVNDFRAILITAKPAT